MKQSIVFAVASLFIFEAASAAQANSHDTYGRAGFSTISPLQWYTISTPSFPQTTPLSNNRNKGFAEGDLDLSPTGLTIGEEGDYWVEITTVLQNPTPDSSLRVLTFLVVNETLNPAAEITGGVAVVNSGSVETIHGTGILRNLQEGDTLSIVAANGSNTPDAKPVTVSAWAITLHKLN